MAKRICIIGGSGFIGRAITRAARAKGHGVTIGCRHPQKARDMQVEGARLIKVDVTTGRGLDEAVANTDCVINLVGLLFERGSQSFDAAHVDGTKNILKACKKAEVKQYLHMSALGASSSSPSKYARTKAAAETAVKRSKLNYTIIRPSIVFGAGDSFFNKFKQMAALAPALPVIEGGTRFQPVWVEDVARVFVKCIGHRNVKSKAFELGGPEVFTFQELLEMMLQTLGWSRLLLPVPRPIAKLMATFMQLLPTPPLTPDQLTLLQSDNVVKKSGLPSTFGKPAALAEILPTYISGHQVLKLQDRLDHSRRHYWESPSG